MGPNNGCNIVLQMQEHTSVEEIVMDVAMEEVTDMIMSTILVLPVKVNANHAMYNLKTKPIVAMGLGMSE